MDVEEVFQKIGGFGRSQKIIYFFVNSVQMVIGFHILGLAFIGVEPPNWTCGKIVEDQSRDSKCLRFGQEKCLPQYPADMSSIVTEWDLICDKSSLTNISQSMFFVGAMLGAWIWGTVADRIGRRKVYFLTILCTFASGLGYSLAPTFYIFAAFRLLVAFSSAGVILSSYVLSIEITGIDYRTFAGLACGGLFALSYPLMAGLAYIIPYWRVFGVVSSVALLGYLALWRIVPESPRWLLVQGREEESRAVLTRIASGNGTTLPAGQLKKPVDSDSEQPVSAIDLFRGKIIRKRTITLFIAWFSNCMLYYALSLSAGDLGGNRYISFSLSGIVEIPSIFLGYLLLDRVGRRSVHGTFLIGGGVACLTVAILSLLGSGGTLKIVIALVGKFAIAGSFAFIYLYTAELYPTQVRNIGVGVSTIGARLGGIFAPIVLLLASYGASLPMLLLGGLGTLTGLLSLTLPETLNQPMPETLRELENNS